MRAHSTICHIGSWQTDWTFRNFQEDNNVNSDQIIGLARHLLTTAGGILVAKGVIDETSMLAVVGSLATIVGVAWSVYAKRRKS